MTGGVYVTGTDTGIGKTVTSCALIAAARSRGETAAGFKPVASGCESTPDGWRNADALALQATGEPGIDYAAINPYALPMPQAPELAARDAGVAIDLDWMVDCARALQERVDWVVVEGVGGWLAPLDRGIEQADLARRLRLPVILVVGLRLGCINHARLTARAIAEDGLQLAGWIGNRIDPDFEAADDNISLLQRDLPANCLGVIPHGEASHSNARHIRWPTC